MRVRFVGGKGGVGKTTCAAALGLAAAARGERVLLVSVDPAHSLGDALGQKLSSRPRAVAGARGRLRALELDADGALERWLEARREPLETIAERGTYLEAPDVRRLLRLSFPGVDELVGLVELARLARDEDPDLLVVDTAPTGHALRLLATPATLTRLARVLDDLLAKHRVVASALAHGRYVPDEADALVDEVDAEGRSLAELLRDPARTAVTWVLLPEELSVAQTRDALAALATEGIAVDEVIANRVARGPREACAPCAERTRAEADSLARLVLVAGERAVRFVPACEDEPRGVPALRAFGKALARRDRGVRLVLDASPRGRKAARRRSSGDGELPIDAGADARLILFGGKGGVGKTTCAATTALELAAREPSRRVLLLSLDPAHSLGNVLAHRIGDAERRVPGGPPNLRVRELDAVRSFEARRARYRDALDDLFAALRTGGDDSYDRAVARDLVDLAPPGIDELFGVLEVTEMLFAEAGPTRHDLLVIDTAPTGHALRLLALPEAAHEWVKTLLDVLLRYRELVKLGAFARELVALAAGLRRLRALLRDRKATRFFPVTRAAELPLLETRRLLRALDRLAIPRGDLIGNGVTSRDGCARCRRVARAEERHLAALARLAGRSATIRAPACGEPPRGVEALRAWGRTWGRLA